MITNIAGKPWIDAAGATNDIQLSCAHHKTIQKPSGINSVIVLSKLYSAYRSYGEVVVSHARACLPTQHCAIETSTSFHGSYLARHHATLRDIATAGDLELDNMNCKVYLSCVYITKLNIMRAIKSIFSMWMMNDDAIPPPAAKPRYHMASQYS